VGDTAPGDHAVHAHFGERKRRDAVNQPELFVAGQELRLEEEAGG
jgi:hypothetical protein